jgi:hypothetical protein
LTEKIGISRYLCFVDNILVRLLEWCILFVFVFLESNGLWCVWFSVVEMMSWKEGEYNDIMENGIQVFTLPDGLLGSYIQTPHMFYNHSHSHILSPFLNFLCYFCLHSSQFQFKKFVFWNLNRVVFSFQIPDLKI